MRESHIEFVEAIMRKTMAICGHFARKPKRKMQCSL